MLDHEQESLFKSWLDQHAGMVLKIARAYTLTAEDCQDLVQEIFLQVWRSLPEFAGRASAATWSYRVALNTALGWKRSQLVRRTNQDPIFEIQDLPERSGDSATQAEQRDRIDRLYAAIRQLPKGDAALVLLYLDDLSYREMAEVLGISESNVGVKLNRAKKSLAELMGDKNETR